MSATVRTYAIFFLPGIVFFLVATLVSDVVARTTIGSESVGYAISQHTYYAVTQPIGTGTLLVPFLLIAWMSFSLARRKTTRYGLVFLCVVCAVLVLIYFLAYQDSQTYMTQHMWTAATLAIGFLIFKSIPVLIIALAAFLILRRKPRAEP